MQVTLKNIALSGLFLSSVTLAKDLMISNDPIIVNLSKNQEVRVEFPETVLDLNIPAKANQALDTFIKPNGAIYWTAKDDIEKTRVIATTADGVVVLLDIQTVDQLNNSDEVITLHQPAKNQAALLNTSQQSDELPDFLKGKVEVDGKKNTQESRQPALNYTDLASFAIQHYIGPSRLIEDLPVTRVKTTRPKKRLLRIWTDRINVQLLDAWHYKDLYITAVKVQNISTQNVAFDPRAINGRYLFVSTTNENLEPRGSIHDQAIWILISNKPFNQALLEH